MSKKSTGNQTPQYVVVLCGLPGSGKSTFSTQLEGKNPNWVRINQDDLGSCQECKKQLEKAIKKKQNVLMDRCNASAGDRKMWITDAKRFGILPSNIEALFFNFSKEVCISRAETRTKHPTLSKEKASEVISSFSRNFKGPEQREGFARVGQISSDKDFRDEMDRLHKLAPTKK